ncbi:type II toxin-antitoxin system VapC family toxin [Alloacidobacterium dinghuense]|uniref:Type II toxin-antitoxin system VapC family toxin n=1 Tax=Alloacidobacterium dinghuense TaxID=2763107 RepID=A0A7G8BLD7_9BACT|nr:type II toxin-antitoxin system VapC family toxin [Alloacidobacterium dinghuense]QNI33357.1 type II toxin-antitoxin system VapC family toxin [Alloacidobacterium dinghuense]
MILADTSIWVDHFRKRDAELQHQLLQNNIATHPFVVTELALGSLPDRRKTLADLELLPKVRIAQTDEVRAMIEFRKLFRKGLGFVDAHLIAAALITPGTILWSRDKQLHSIAQSMGISHAHP